MAGNTRVTGLKIICMVKVFILGKMAGNMMVIIIWIKSMDLVYISGLMGVNMKECGKMVNSMVRVSTLQPMESPGEDFGKMENVLNG